MSIKYTHILILVIVSILVILVCAWFFFPGSLTKLSTERVKTSQNYEPISSNITTNIKSVTPAVDNNNQDATPLVETAGGFTTYVYKSGQWKQGEMGIKFSFPSLWNITSELSNDGKTTAVELAGNNINIRIDQRGMDAPSDWSYAYEIDGRPARTWTRTLEDGRHFMMVSPERSEFIFRIFVDNDDFSEVDKFLSTITFSSL